MDVAIENEIATKKPEISFSLLIRLISSANVSENPYLKRKRDRQQAMLVRCGFNGKLKPPLPCLVILTRLGSRTLGSDNLQFAFKKIRDEVADCIIPGLARGRADDDERITWDYAQEKSKMDGIRVEIYAV